MSGALADRLMHFCSEHSNQIAEQWYKTISTNSKTLTYHTMLKENCLRHAEFILRNLEKVYFSENPFQEVAHLLDVDGFVEERFAHNVPLDQVVYAIILLRRQLWLYAEFQALYSGVYDMMQMVDNINRVLLVFDYIIFITVGKYRTMSMEFSERKAVKAK